MVKIPIKHMGVYESRDSYFLLIGSYSNPELYTRLWLSSRVGPSNTMLLEEWLSLWEHDDNPPKYLGQLDELPELLGNYLKENEDAL